MNDQVAEKFQDLIQTIKAQTPTRETSLAVTNIEQAWLWWSWGTNVTGLTTKTNQTTQQKAAG